MMDERRDSERCPSFSVVDLIAKNTKGVERCVPIMLRDTSSNGLGGVYIDQEPLDADEELFVRETEAVLTKVRAVWKKRVADYVYLLGLEKIDRT
jgi:hypothetical protein